MSERQPKFEQPCFLAMSENDPTLSFQKTVEILKNQFTRLHVERFSHPYHQPPKPLTYGEIVQQYNPLLQYLQ
jgi:hypothetical protein